jgi:hypothetical protein
MYELETCRVFLSQPKLEVLDPSLKASGSVSEGAVRSFAVVFLTPGVLGSPHVVRRVEPVWVETFVAQPSIEVFGE